MAAGDTTPTSRDSWLPVVGPRLVILVLVTSLLVGLLPLPAISALLIVNSLVLVVALADCFLTLRPSKVRIERRIAGVLAMDTSAQIHWTISNPRRRPLHVAIADEIPPSFTASARRFSFLVPGSGHVEAEASIRPSRRGRFEISEVTVRVQGPLRLLARQGTQKIPSSVRVYPPFRSEQEAELRIAKGRVLETGLRSVRAHGGGTEFEQLREYTVDDDYRRMDWPATARNAKPIVRTYRAEQNQNVVLLLDCGRVMAGQVAGVARLELAMDAAMTLTAVASRLGDRVGMIAFDRTVHTEVAARQRSSSLARVVEAMYQLQPQLVESDYTSAFVHVLSRFRRRSLVVLLTDMSEAAVTETLLPALPMLSKSHLLLVGSVADPAVSDWAGGMPEELNLAYRKAAAVASLSERSRTAKLLQNRGVRVVDAPPAELAARLADAYLDVKATGTL